VPYSDGLSPELARSSSAASHRRFSNSARSVCNVIPTLDGDHRGASLLRTSPRPGRQAPPGCRGLVGVAQAPSSPPIQAAPATSVRPQHDRRRRDNRLPQARSIRRCTTILAYAAAWVSRRRQLSRIRRGAGLASGRRTRSFRHQAAALSGPTTSPLWCEVTPGSTSFLEA
jgi:hypothetical protein